MGVLLMLMMIGGLVLAVVLLAVGLFGGRKRLVKFTAAAVAVWLVGYVVLLLGASLSSKEVTLKFNEPKEFCGFYLDCHMHAAVTGVETLPSLGAAKAKGLYYIVTVKVFNNARRATLGLLTADAHVVDASGNLYQRDPAAEAELGSQPELEKKLGPGESFEKKIVFDLPTEVANPRLDVRDGYGIDHVIESLLVGDEDSVLHKRVYFGLQQ